MYWLLYDISDNRRRNKLAQLCKDFGMIRVQKSCFYGEIEKKSKHRFDAMLNSLLIPDDQVCVIPVSRDDQAKTTFLGSGVDIGNEDDCVVYF